MRDFDIMLHRQLKNGKEFERLIPESNCTSVSLGTGYTDHSITAIVKWIELHSGHMSKVAQRVQATSLQQTCNAVYRFCYDHFQYKADDEDQILRSPACAWKQRHTGIDCKSYTIIAGSILRELGIGHYIRKIKQPGFAPNEYTHVYVVVPKDQTNYELRKGYYTIDGTTHDNVEPGFLTAKDEFMSGLKHYGLQGADAQGLNGFSLNNITLRNVMCGASAFSQDSFDKTKAALERYYNDLFARMNNAIVQNNEAAFSGTLDEFDLHTKLWLKCSQIKQSERDWRSPCTEARLQAQTDILNFYNTSVRNALNLWVSNYFVVTSTDETLSATNRTANDTYLTWREFLYVGNEVVMSKKATKVSIRPGVSEIKAFEITPYVAQNQSSPNAVNDINKLLGQLNEVAAVFTPSNGGAHPSNPGSYPNGLYPVQDNIGAKPPLKIAGMGAGTALAAAGIAFLGWAIIKNPPKKTTK